MNTMTDIDPKTEQLMMALARHVRAAARVVALADAATKTAALTSAAAILRERCTDVLRANAGDIDMARAAGRPDAFIDRLSLNEKRVEGIAASLEDIAALPDPVGAVMAEWTRPNGLTIARVRVPLGVVGIIFESRPNVTADAGALCLKSGNAALLRAGSESLGSAKAIHACLAAGLENAGLPAAAISLVPVPERSAVGLMLQGLGGAIDVIVPRGGKSLVARVQSEARVPVFAHLEGICHTYVDRAADIEKAVAIAVNAKLRRTGVCGATECLLVDRAAPAGVLARLVGALIDAGCEVRGDEATCAADARAKVATPADYGHEFLDRIIAVKVVGGVDGAIAHIARYGSAHTDAIITEDAGAADRFTREVDSAILLVNASTQFADGGEFGFGAEIGIATGKMHARGPVGVEQLTSFKYVVRGSGQIRPA